MRYEYLHPRNEPVLTMQRIYRYKMTTTYGGNPSILDENGDMWITPTGVDKGTLTPNDIMYVRADGRIEGLHRPSSEYPFHKAIHAVLDVQPIGGHVVMSQEIIDDLIDAFRLERVRPRPAP